MSDGNTAIPVGPVPTEEEMNQVQAYFKRALDSIMSVSQLSEAVTDLTRQVNALKLDVDSYRAQNTRLDEALSLTRKQRDDAELAVSHLKTELANSTAANERVTAERDTALATQEALRQEIQSLRSERDRYGLEAMEAQEALNKANETIERFKSMAGSILSASQDLRPVSVSPDPIPIPLTTSEIPPEPETGPITTSSEPTPAPAMQPTPTSIDWDKPYHWDNEKAYYVNDPEPKPAEDLPGVAPWVNPNR